MNTLILSSSNRNFPLDLLGVLENAGIPCSRLASLPEFISSPLRSRPFFAVLEVGNKEDIDRALIAYEWAQNVQPQAPARFLLLVGSRHISLSEKAFRFGGVEIAQLPLPNKNLLFKIDLQLKLLEKEASRPPRDAEGFFAEFSGPTRERVMVMRGPRKGSWESEAPHGKVRWRWVTADAPKKEELTWTVQSFQAPVFDEKENRWKVKDPGAQLSCQKEGMVLFLARDEGNSVTGEEPPKDEAATPGGEPEGLAPPRKEKGARESTKKPDPLLPETPAPEGEPLPGPSPGHSQARTESETHAAARPEMFSAPAEERGSHSIAQPWNVKGPEERVTGEPGRNPDSAGAPAPSAAARELDSQKEKAAPAQEASLSGAEGGTPAASASVSSSLPVEHLVSSELGRASPATAATAGMKSHSSSGEEVSSLRSLLGREEERVSSASIASEPKAERKSGEKNARTEEVSRAASPSGKETNAVPGKQQNAAPLREEAEEQAPPREKPSHPGEERASPEDARPASDQRAARPPRHEEAASPPVSEPLSWAPSHPEEEARRRETSPPVPQTTLSSTYSPQEMESRIKGDSARNSASSTSGGEGRREGRIEVHLHATPAPAEDTNVTGSGGGAEDPEHFLKMRHFVTLSLEELQDRNSSWYPVEGYRIYLSAQHRYYGFQRVEEVLPLWIYEGELAPEFLDLKKAWKFYDRKPVLFGSKLDLPPAVLAYLQKSAGEKVIEEGTVPLSPEGTKPEARSETKPEAEFVSGPTGASPGKTKIIPPEPLAQPEEEEGNLFVRLVRKVFGKS